MKDLEEIFEAKEYLSTNGEASVYNKISTIISTVLDERPTCPIDHIAKYMDDIQVEEDKQDTQRQGNFAETQIKLFDKSNEEEIRDGITDNEEEFEIPLPNCAQINFYFEQAGIGLGCEEMYRIFLALKQLVFSHPLNSTRFWGKIFGVESNYIIAEAEYRDGEGDDEEENVEPEEDDGTQGQLSDDGKDDEGPTEEDTIPKSAWKPPPPIPKEDHRTGVNKKVYFVCNEPGEQWVKLPHATPTEINAARSITKLMTGRLDAKVDSYPPFPGNESNYLRAQIARISASTQISPASYFIFDDEEEEEEEEVRETYMLNVEYEGMSLKELTDSSMINWVHHTQHILPQGRCQWFNPSEKPEDDFEEEEYDDDEEEDSNIILAETGPTLLSSVAHDNAIGNMPAWSTYISSRVLPEYAVAVVRSNRWLGAYAFATPRLFDNIYIGWGNKHTSTCYNPPAPPPALEEFPEAQEMRELDDPTVEEEKALKERKEEALREAEEIDDVDDEDDE